MNQINQAKQYLIACFQSKGFQPFFVLSKNSMLKVLDNLASKEFNRELGQELLEKCPTDHRGHLKIEDFIEIIIQADNQLNQKIHQSNKYIEQQVSNRQQIMYKAQLAQNKQNGQYLEVKIISGRYLYSGQLSITHKPYVVIHFGTEKKSSNLATNDMVNPEWNETFRFQVRSGSENTYVSVLDLDEVSKQTKLLGEVHYSISELQDQLRHNQWFNLYDLHGQQLQGSIQLELQLIIDEAQFQSEALNVIDQQIQVAQQEKQQYEQDLINLYQPFPAEHLNKPQQIIVPDAPPLMFVNELSKPIVFQGDKRIDLMLYKNPLLSDSRVNQILNIPPDSSTTVQAGNNYPAEDDLKNKANYGYGFITNDSKIALILIILYCLGSLYLCFVKTDFINITLAFMIAFIICLNYFEKNHLNVFSIQIMITILFDLVWLAAYQDVWWDQTKNPQEDSQLITIQRRTIVVNYALIIIKILLACQLWSLKNQMGNLNEQKQFGLGLHLYQVNSGFTNPFIDTFRIQK